MRAWMRVASATTSDDRAAFGRDAAWCGSYQQETRVQWARRGALKTAGWPVGHPENYAAFYSLARLASQTSAQSLPSCLGT